MLKKVVTTVLVIGSLGLGFGAKADTIKETVTESVVVQKAEAFRQVHREYPADLVRNVQKIGTWYDQSGNTVDVNMVTSDRGSKVTVFVYSEDMGHIVLLKTNLTKLKQLNSLIYQATKDLSAKERAGK